MIKNRGVSIPLVAEFTFLRNDRDSFNEFQTKFPHNLDTDNTNDKQHIVLPENWYRKS